MNAKSDVQLLREYAQDGNESAFREIVLRHTDLIYSSALRQTTSPDLAQDVAQSVFADLARKARTLADSLEQNSSLLGWLFRSTRFVALNQLRDGRRRQTHERELMEILSPASETAPEWDQIRSVLDGAMSDLSEQDRDALLLRFFKNQDFRAIGETLGVSEDAAQKRVSRALERLHAQFVRAGVTTTAAALSTALAANAVTKAPAGLASTLATNALSGSAIVPLAVAPVAKTIAMTALQKALVTAAVATAVGTGIFQARQSITLRDQVSALQQQQAPLLAQIEQLSRNYAEATNRLAIIGYENERLNSNTRELLRLRGEVPRLRADSQELARLKGGHSNDDEVLGDKTLLEKVRLLKERLEQTPKEKIPEIQFLILQDWITAAAECKLDSDDDFRAAFADLRGRGESAFLQMASTALSKFLATNDGQFPTEVAQLKACFDKPPSDEILERYKIVPANSIPFAGAPGDWLITLKSPDTDSQEWASRSGTGGTAGGPISGEMAVLARAMKAAMEAAPKINGIKGIRIEDIVPYLTTPEEKAAYQSLVDRRNAKTQAKGKDD